MLLISLLTILFPLFIIFSKPQDIEIIGLWIAIIAWGNRKSIINSGHRLIELMDHSPHDFIATINQSTESDFQHLSIERFNMMIVCILDFLQHYYAEHTSLEPLFADPIQNKKTIEEGLIHFRSVFFNRNIHLKRTEKHIANPLRGSTCKRLCMFLRWMSRKDDKGVDFGIWTKIHPKQLMIPMDVHVERVAKKLGLLTRKQRDWKAVDRVD